MSEIFLQYGIAGLILGVLFFVIKMMMKYFIDALKDSREDVKKIASDFNETVTNHMSGYKNVINKNTEVLYKVLRKLDK